MGEVIEYREGHGYLCVECGRTFVPKKVKTNSDLLLCAGCKKNSTA